MKEKLFMPLNIQTFAYDSNGTKLAELINPEVMADMVSAKVEKKIRVMPYAKLDTTLQGQAGDTITVPRYDYIGDAEDVGEGEDIPVKKLETSTSKYSIKKIGIGGILTDEAVLSGYGNPVGELNNQMAKSIGSKCDNDAMDELCKAHTNYTASDVMSYETIVNAIDVFDEEENSEKVTFIHPKQVTQLRLDPNFISKEKYGNQVMVDGEIGIIGNARIVPSKKVKEASEYYTLNTSGTLTIVESGGDDSSTVDLEKVALTCPAAKVGDKVNKTTADIYLNPIVKLESDTETEDETPALTVYLKRDTNIETERKSRNRSTEVTGDKMFVVALTNGTKVVVCRTPKASV